MAGASAAFDRNLLIGIAGGAALALGGVALWGWSRGPSMDEPPPAYSDVECGNTYIDREPIYERRFFGHFAPVVRRRLHDTYWYVGGGLALTAATAVGIHATGLAENIITDDRALPAFFAALASTAISSVSLYFIPKRMNKTRHAVWVMMCSSAGMLMAPMGYFGAGVVTEAAIATGSIVGACSLIGMSAPSEVFFFLGSALALGCSIIFATAVTALAVPDPVLLESGMTYANIVLIGATVMLDTYMLLDRAHYQSEEVFDPLTSSLDLYWDTLNIFVEVVKSIVLNKEESEEDW